MNLVGAEGKGRVSGSAWFLCDCCREWQSWQHLMQQPELSQALSEQEEPPWSERIEKSAWDGEWYLRGTFDDGTSARLGRKH